MPQIPSSTVCPYATQLMQKCHRSHGPLNSEFIDNCSDSLSSLIIKVHFEIRHSPKNSTSKRFHDMAKCWFRHVFPSSIKVFTHHTYN